MIVFCECGRVRKTRGIGSTAPVAVTEPVSPAISLLEEVIGISSKRAEAQPGQQRSHYPDWSAGFNRKVPQNWPLWARVSIRDISHSPGGKIS